MESFTKFQGSKEEQYQHINEQAKALFSQEKNPIANAANLCALLKEQFDWFWVGFYFVDESNNTLVLGPFQGPLACTRIPFGKGVCGTAWAEEKVQVVADVNQFPGHIACNSLSQSEIVVPLFNLQGKIVGVLDVDSASLDSFDAIDAQYLKDLGQIWTNAW